MNVTPINNIRIGIAGWTIPKASAEHFPAEGSHLERYTARFKTVEINSSFYRPHRPATYTRWAAAVPDDFDFTIKIPKAITHEHRLIDAAERFKQFLAEVQGLGSKLGALLVQLPPSLVYEATIVSSFFGMMRESFAGSIVCEPRHATWFTPQAAQTLATFQVSYVAADPIVGEVPAGLPIAYYRLHGSPQIYYSSYSEEYLSQLAMTLKEASQRQTCWCIFDNTAIGHATENALRLTELVE